jgi:hypothetical protein
MSLDTESFSRIGRTAISCGTHRAKRIPGTSDKLFLKSSVFWDIAESRCFEGTYRLLLQGRRINQAKNQHEVGSKL